MPLRLLVLAAAITVWSPAKARAGAPPPERMLEGRFAQIVAVAGGVVTLRDRTALFLDGAGQVIGRCGGPPAPPPARRVADPRDDVQDILRAAGLPDDDDGSPEAEAALEDEATRPRRRAPVPEAPGFVPHALAAGGNGDTVWIATSAGLWRARADGAGCAPAALARFEVALVAAAADVVVAAAGETVWRSTDGGRAFAVAAVLPEPPRALAVTSDGAATLVGTAEGALEVIATQAVRRVLEGRTDALAACGDVVLALASDGAYTWTPGGRALRAGDRPPARVASCAAELAGPTRATAWVASGVGLWTSPDGGSWAEARAGDGLSIAGAVRAPAGWWLATDDGLFLARDQPPRPVLGDPAPASGGCEPAAPPAARAPPAWRTALPRVGLAVGGGRDSRGHAEWRAFVLITVPLGGVARIAADLAELARERARRRAASALEQARRAAGPPTAEAAALQAALACEREASR